MCGLVAGVLTICYLTSRVDCKIKWFFDSLRMQLPAPGGTELPKIVVVDFHAELPGRREEFAAMWPYPITHVTPKPNVYQGPHRLTKEDFFAAANARNTGVCYAPDGWIAFVDDLSVLLPTWFDAVEKAIAGGYIGLGAYKKVRSLVVEAGKVVSCDEFPGGTDTRLNYLTGETNSCGGDLAYGSSLIMPVEAVLTVNGYPEDLTGCLSFEDVLFGICLGNTNKFSFRYCRNMMTYESEEDHYLEKPMKRIDKGISPRDKSHSALAIAKQSKYFPNSFGPEGLRGLRARILNGEPFPIPKTPDRDWFDGKLIAEMP